jgi:hypothetical protein
MQSLKIVLTCIVAAVLYGIIHDQFTAHICVEYFSVFHPPVFPTQSPALLAVGWGVIATWWMGASLGALLAFAARAGSRRKITASELIRPITKLLMTMGILAAIAALSGYVLARSGAIGPPEWIAAMLPYARRARFMADWWAHNTSYAVGFFGGIALCIATFLKRRSPPTAKTERPLMQG